MEKPVSIYAAYRLICENARKAEALRKNAVKARTVEVDGVEAVKSAIGQGGPATDRFADVDAAEHPNRRYSEKALVSPFCGKTSACNARSGVFSQDLATVEAALSQGVATNKPVQSRLIPMWFGDAAAYDSVPHLDLGLVDALTWQCLMGADMNVRAILKAGYDAKKRYDGLNPITAAIRGRNLQCLKLVLAVPSVAELVNEKDGFGSRPLQCAAEIAGIDPFEFAREVVRAGGVDRGYRDGQYSALMLCLMRRGGGAIWTPNIFAEILPVSDLSYKAKDGETVESLARALGNEDAMRMILNWRKFGQESLNNAILNNGISF